MLYNLEKAILCNKNLSIFFDASKRWDIYLVGGYIRDLFFGKKSLDYDFVIIEGDPTTFLSYISDKLRRKPFNLGKRFPTYRLCKKGLIFDFTFSKDGIYNDLKRRDFTINSVAFSFTNRVFVDPLGGISDLAKKVLKKSSKSSILDDPIRIMRAIRYKLEFGMEMDKELEDEIRSKASLLRNVKAERVKQELFRIIELDNIHKGFLLLKNYGIFKFIFPEIEFEGKVEELFLSISSILEKEGEKKIDKKLLFFPLIFLDLNSKRAKILMKGLRFSNREIRSVLMVKEGVSTFFSGFSDDRDRIKFLLKFEDLFPYIRVILLALAKVLRNDRIVPELSKLDKKRDNISVYKEKIIDGADIISLGVKEGPRVGEILDQIFEKRLLGEISKREEAIEFVKKLIKYDGKI